MIDDPDNIIKSGTCGENLKWVLTGNKNSYTLTVSGTGKMKDYTVSSKAPWGGYRSSIKTVKINSGVTSIGDWAFCACIGLTSVNIPDSVTSIGDSAFVNCRSLKSVIIPDLVIYIEKRTFGGCHNLKSIIIPNSVTSIGDSAFSECNSLTSVIIPDTVTAIGNSAFWSCSSLKSVIIPNSVTSIGNSAFWSCSSLTSLYIHSKIPARMGSNVFDSIDKNKCTLYVPKGTVSAYRETTGWNYFTRIAEIPDENYKADNGKSATNTDAVAKIPNKNKQNRSTKTEFFNMQTIINNPYRILGLLVGATAREENRQIQRLKQYIEAEEQPPVDYSFPVLGQLPRTAESVTEAASKLNLDSDRMASALFWFYKGNEITDEPALDALKEGNTKSALDIWSKLTANNEVTNRNASAFQNLSTLLLANVSSDTFMQGIALKLKFLESDFAKDFKALATDITYTITKKDLQLLFLNQLCTETEKWGNAAVNQLISILNEQMFSAKEDFLNAFVQKQTEAIQRKINDTKSKRGNNAENAVEFGNELYNDTITSIQQLKIMLGDTHHKFVSVIDKIANEMLQCSIDFFNYSQDKNLDNNYHDKALTLGKTAQSIAVGSGIKEKIKENLQTIEKMKSYNLCYYCGREIADSGSAYKKTIYKETDRSTSWDGSRRVEFQYIEVTIPRCQKCKKIHNISNWAFWVPIILFTVIGLGLGLTIWEYWFLCLIGGGIVGLITGYILDAIISSIKTSRAKIKKESKFTEFEPVKEMLDSGWQLTKPTA